MKRLFGMLVVALMALALPTVVGAAPAGGVGIGLPGAAGQDYIEHTMTPGQTLTRQVRVHNHGAQTREIAVTVGPATEDGGGFTEAPADRIDPLVDWTEIDRPTVTVPGGQSTDVIVTVTVPSDAPDTAQRAIVWAGVDGAKAGVRMYIDVAGDNGPAIAPEIGRITGERGTDGTAVVRAAVTNTAGYPVRIGAELDLTGGPGGTAIRGVRAPQIALAPGESADLTFAVPGGRAVADGPWQVQIRAEDGYTHASARAEVTFPAPSTGGGGSGSAGSLGSLDLFGSLG